MPISFGSRPKEDDVLSLIAARSYGRAIALLRARLSQGGPNPTLRMQLADVLILADKKAEALTLLLRLADEYAGEGFAAKAVSVLKKAQRIDPGRPDVESRLAQLIQAKQREAATRLAEPDATLEIGLDAGTISVPASLPSPLPAPVSPRPGLLDLDPDATLPYETSAQPPRAQAPPAEPKLEAEPLPALSEEPLLEAELVPEAATDDADVEDYDLLYAGEAEEPATSEATAAARGAGQPMSAGEFAHELMSLVDTVFQESAAA
ncbi:MAG TPA: hypothetical protein VEQ10_10005, partial [Vicinamibacteria bacterium]|nr:hypothetical protein [Vicinamibacteria bacterium]